MKAIPNTTLTFQYKWSSNFWVTFRKITLKMTIVQTSCHHCPYCGQMNNNFHKRDLIVKHEQISGRTCIENLKNYGEFSIWRIIYLHHHHWFWKTWNSKWFFLSNYKYIRWLPYLSYLNIMQQTSTCLLIYMFSCFGFLVIYSCIYAHWWESDFYQSGIWHITHGGMSLLEAFGDVDAKWESSLKFFHNFLIVVLVAQFTKTLLKFFLRVVVLLGYWELGVQNLGV